MGSRPEEIVLLTQKQNSFCRGQVSSEFRDNSKICSSGTTTSGQDSQTETKSLRRSPWRVGGAVLPSEIKWRPCKVDFGSRIVDTAPKSPCSRILLLFWDALFHDPANERVCRSHKLLALICPLFGILVGVLTQDLSRKHSGISLDADCRSRRTRSQIAT